MPDFVFRPGNKLALDLTGQIIILNLHPMPPSTDSDNFKVGLQGPSSEKKKEFQAIQSNIINFLLKVPPYCT